MNQLLLTAWLSMPISLLEAIHLPIEAAADVPLRVEKGVTYATVDGARLQLDIAVPKDGGPYPAVVCFHGGAWRGGSRSDLSRPSRDKDEKPGPSVIEAIAARGYAVASVGYRLAPACRFPAQLDDARAAVRFLRANAAKFNLDPDRVGALGFSAGAHLALLLGTVGTDAESEDGDSTAGTDARVGCVVSFFGPTDLSLYAASPGLEDAFMVPFLGKACKTDPEVYKRASPIERVSPAAAPVLMIHGTADFVVPIVHSERMLRKLRDAGVTAELIPVRGGGHGWVGETAVRTLDDATRFLDKHLKVKK
jgi:acetyl esterase/lipase